MNVSSQAPRTMEFLLEDQHGDKKVNIIYINKHICKIIIIVI